MLRAADTAPRPWLRPWVLLLPLAALLLLLGAVGGLLWLSTEREADERRQQQIADALWLRQSIQYQLERSIDRVATLVQDLERDPAHPVSSELAALLRTSSEVVGVGLVDADGRTLLWRSREASGDTAAFVTAFSGTQRRELLLAAERIRRPLLTPVYIGPYGSAFDIVAATDEKRQRFVVAIVSLDRVLSDLAPWWLAQDNEIALTDTAGEIGARRAAGGPGRGEFVHQTSLDLSDLQLILRTDRARPAQGVMADVLRASIALLALLLAASLLLLWRDSRRRLAAERRLRDEHSFRTAIGDSVRTGLRARDLDGRVTYVNPAFCAMVGYSADELIGQSAPWPYWAPESIAVYQSRMQARMRRVLDEQAVIEPYETLFHRRDGTPLPVVIYESPLRDASGRQTGWMSSIVDISERKQREEVERVQQERLQTAARLTTMGEMATSLAHELNQPLAAIRSYLTGSLNLLAAGAGADELDETLRKADRQAQRAGEIIRRVHDFARGRGPERTRLSLPVLIDDAWPLFELQARKRQVVLRRQIGDDLPDVLGDRVALEQVLLNLTRNAIEAMQDAPAGPAVLTIDARRGPDGGAEVSVTDTGAGIAPDVQARLFEPFFTTKREGLGIGLNICRSLVESHGGRLLVESETASGTTVRMLLPAAPATRALELQ